MLNGYKFNPFQLKVREIYEQEGNKQPNHEDWYF